MTTNRSPILAEDSNARRDVDYGSSFDPKIIAKISGLELRAKTVVDGLYAGKHRSPRRGVSVEFAAHRPYVQGDDIRRIDWKVFARTDRHYIREYLQETNLSLILAVDGSSSMSYRWEQSSLSKFDYSAVASAAFAHLAIAQHDNAGLAIFDTSIRTMVAPSSNPLQWQSIVEALSRHTCDGPTGFENVCDELSERLAHRSLVFVLSDLIEQPESILRGVKRLRYAGHDVALLSILDKAELTFPFNGPTQFQDLETERNLLTDPQAIRREYLEELRKHQSVIRSGCGDLQTDYEVVSTSTSLGAAISSYLAARNSHSQDRSIHQRQVRRAAAPKAPTTSQPASGEE